MSSERDAERRVPFNGRVVVDLESDAYDHIFTDTPPHRRRVASVYGRDAEVANRLAACWNACIGMEDPEAELLAVSGERDRLRKALTDLLAECNPARHDDPETGWYLSPMTTNGIEKAKVALGLPGFPEASSEQSLDVIGGRDD